jgi:hypothetical protein
VLWKNAHGDLYSKEIMEVYLSSDAASEAALRDNAALRQKSLLPVVIHVYSPS